MTDKAVDDQRAEVSAGRSTGHEEHGGIAAVIDDVVSHPGQRPLHVDQLLGEPESRGQAIVDRHADVVPASEPMHQRLALLDLNGEVTEEELDLQPALFQAPAWSPDGEKWLLAAETESEEEGLLLTDTNGEILQVLKSMDDTIAFSWSPDGEWVALLPGSKAAKLSVGMPFLLDTADRLARLRPGCRFLLPIAPTTTAEELLQFAAETNPIARCYDTAVASCHGDQLVTRAGTTIRLLTQHPAHGPLSQCALALTTVGANTAELGALGVPMIVIVPTQHLEVMQAWDGAIGLLARLPLLRRLIGGLLSLWRLRHNGLMAWPNISAGRAVVPERVGAITPQQIAEEAADWLAAPDRLQGQRDDLQALRGQPGAVAALAEEVRQLLPRQIGSA